MTRDAPATTPDCVDQIPTPAENQLYPYSDTVCAHRHSHDFEAGLAIGAQLH